MGRAAPGGRPHHSCKTWRRVRFLRRDFRSANESEGGRLILVADEFAFATAALATALASPAAALTTFRVKPCGTGSSVDFSTALRRQVPNLAANVTCLVEVWAIANPVVEAAAGMAFGLAVAITRNMADLREQEHCQL